VGVGKIKENWSLVSCEVTWKWKVYCFLYVVGEWRGKERSEGVWLLIFICIGEDVKELACM
jgi:hypothetical protein